MSRFAATASSVLVYGVSSLIGVVAFLYPFWLPGLMQTRQIGLAHGQTAPFVLSLLVFLCLVVLLLEVQQDGISTRLVALLGVLVALNTVLRFAEVAVPGPGGFSPIFFLIITTGYVFGARFGFLMGALTLFVSSLVTGGVGPWLPYQMLTAAWMGMSAAPFKPLLARLGLANRVPEVVVLAALSAWWGLTYGLIMNIWFWPFASGDPSQYWQAGITLWETLERYAAFYLVTSLAWDLLRAFGNALLMFAFGLPTLRLLRRFHARFAFVYQANTEVTSVAAPNPALKTQDAI